VILFKVFEGVFFKGREWMKTLQTQDILKDKLKSIKEIQKRKLRRTDENR